MVEGAIMQNVDKDFEKYFPVYTKEELLAELAISREQARKGQVRDFDEALDEICKKLGIPD